MHLYTIICCCLLTIGTANAQRCPALVDTIFDSRSGSATINGHATGPAIVFQKQKTPGTTADGKTGFLWLRRDFASGPSMWMGDQYGTVSVKTSNYIFLYGELIHDSTLRDFGEDDRYHGKVTFTFADGDSITLQTYPTSVDRFYPNRQNISFVILLNNRQAFRNDEMRKIFGIRKVKMPGATALRDKIRAQPVKQLRYRQSYIKRDGDGIAELHYAEPVIISFTEEEAKRFQKAASCITSKVVDTRFP